jgi:signal transduction histidine kinase
MRRLPLLAATTARDEVRIVQKFCQESNELGATMPAHTPTVGSEQALAHMIEELRQELSQAHRREAATTEILKIISCSPADLQPVFDGILKSAIELCDAYLGLLNLYDGLKLRTVAQRGGNPGLAKWVFDRGPFQPDGEVVRGTLAEGRPFQTPDMRESAGGPNTIKFTELGGVRTFLSVPLLGVGKVIGNIGIYRPEVRPFTEQQINLVTTFAAQAVIAIENTRLFEAEQERSRELIERTQELTETLEYQTATADVLNVISRSPNELQPVLNAIVATAGRLCEADYAHCRLERDGRYHVMARHALNPEEVESVPGIPVIADRSSVSGKVVSECRTIHVPDVLADPEDTYAVSAGVPARTILGVPLVRDGKAIGVIVLFRRTVRPFTRRQIDLVTTFASQAVIAIENSRLFEAEQASKRELTEALEQQTATADVLKVISRSALDVQKVLDALVESAARLCDANDAAIFQMFGNNLRLVAHHGQIPTVGPVGQLMIPLERGSMGARAVIDRRPIHVADILAEGDEYPASRKRALQNGHRTALAVPLVHAGDAIGFILIRRTEVRPFTERQIELVNTFADQAVIAIENTRLFEAEQASKRELARSVEELESLGKVSRAVNSSLELDKVLPTILEHACAMSYAGGGTVYVFDKTTSGFRLAAAHNMSDEHVAMVRAQPMRLNSVVVGECATRREVVQVADLSSAPPSPLLDILLRTGVRAVLAVPLLHQAEVVGVLVVRRNQPGTFSPEVIRLVEAFAAQSAIAVENARLFGEIAQKSRELEIASQHKSQFVANMSHELRTPLAAILGYAELIQEGFYEPQGPKSLDALARIRSNGKHLLGLINAVLDIAKIESGQFTLNMSEYAIESVIETVRAATESLAQNKKLTLTTSVDKSLPVGLGDEQRLTQVLLNLVGNAIKFTNIGEVRVSAKAVDGHFNISVTDTGPGIPEQEQVRIFEQFHQVDSSLTKAAGGTGLGLAIAKQIVEMHGGRIWVESTLGKGSTFQMELPTRAEFRKRAP